MTFILSVAKHFNYSVFVSNPLTNNTISSIYSKLNLIHSEFKTKSKERRPIIERNNAISGSGDPVPCGKSSTRSARERLAPLPACQYTSTMKVAGFAGECERTAGSQQGDIIACRVATMGEVTHVRPHITGKDGEDCTPRYIHTGFSQCVCVCAHCVFASVCAECVFPSVCLQSHNVCTL